MPDRADILLPFFGVILLTLIVWLVMYARRLTYIRRQRIDLKDIDTPDKVATTVPYYVQLPAHNLKNLFELPVIFYAVCLYLYVSDSVDRFFLVAAWVFFVFRVLHSIIYCSYNEVLHRFSAYLVSAIALWAMVVGAVAGLLSGA